MKSKKNTKTLDEVNRNNHPLMGQHVPHSIGVAKIEMITNAITDRDEHHWNGQLLTARRGHGPIAAAWWSIWINNLSVWFKSRFGRARKSSKSLHLYAAPLDIKYIFLISYSSILDLDAIGAAFISCYDRYDGFSLWVMLRSLHTCYGWM